MVRDRIILGIRDSNTRTELLKTRNLTLKMCYDICKAAENALSHGKAIRPEETVNKVRPKKSVVPVDSRKTGKTYSSEKICKFCGGSHPFLKSECPAYGKTCNNCNKKNHFSVKCPFSKKGKKQVKPTKSVNHLKSESEYESSDSGEWINVVNSIKNCGYSKDVKCIMTTNKQDVVFQIDTGSSVNALPERYAKNIVESDVVLSTWNNSQQKILGKSRQSIRNPKNGKKYSVEFVVFKGNFTPILGLRASKQMGLIDVCEENFERILSLQDFKCEDIMNDNLGCFPGTHTLKVKNDVQPVIMPTRRVPISVRPTLKKELDRLTELGVIKPVDEATPWLSHIAISTKKSGKMRICIDPKELNKALLREHYVLPVLDDVLYEMGQSKVFSKADLSSGYWHVKLDDPSSMLTTF